MSCTEKKIDFLRIAHTIFSTAVWKINQIWIFSIFYYVIIFKLKAESKLFCFRYHRERILFMKNCESFDIEEYTYILEK
jgi:hypothetical protein